MKLFGLKFSKDSLKDSLIDNTRLPLWLSIIIALLIVLSVIDLWLSFKTLKLRPSLTVLQREIKPLANIAEFHLFGRYDVELSNLPETNLQLQLQGTLVNPQNANLSLAIISSAGAPAKVYKIGQAIPGNAVIKQILAAEVIIDNNGQLESLRLPKLKLDQTI